MSTDSVTDQIDYRQIPGAPGHRFGSDGKAWSCHLHGRSTLGDTWNIQEGHLGGSGHRWLYIRVTGERVHVRLDEAFTWAWHGARLPGTECLHSDRDLANNRPDNVYWGILPENVRDPSLDYRTLPGLDGYLFCEDGSIWSFWFVGKRGITDVCRRMKFTNLSKGHLQVSLRYKGKAERRFGVHRLICTAFHGDPPSEHECRHLDGNPQNNRADNLMWGTRQQNTDDAIRTRSLAHGEKHYGSKLTDDDVRAIRAAFDGNRGTVAELARQYKVTPQSLREVVQGRTWKHLYEEDRDAVSNQYVKLPRVYTATHDPQRGVWIVTNTKESGKIIFDCPVSEARAREYAQWKNSQELRG